MRQQSEGILEERKKNEEERERLGEKKSAMGIRPTSRKGIGCGRYSYWQKER